uniref:hypothetical protein n=1 Tax=Streptomyces sp. CA-136453 TaxID=3240050 RepID=UPI003F491DAD
MPEGLLTKTQLSAQGLKPVCEPVAQVLYHGNSYAPLYVVDDAVPKQACSPAKRAVLDRARALQYVCRRCGRRSDEPLGRGRWCSPCSYAAALFVEHDQAQRDARQLVADESALLLVVDIDPEALPDTQAVAVVRVHDHHVLYTSPAGEYGTPERAAVLDRLGALLAGHPLVRELDHMGPTHRYPARLLCPPGERLYRQGDEPQWAGRQESIAAIWARWFGWTDHPTSTIPSVPRDGATVPWSRSLDVAGDGQSMTALLHRIAVGTEPVWDRALWTTDGHGDPDLSWDRTRRTKAVSA